jgi:rhamnogalacturonan endolyase
MTENLFDIKRLPGWLVAMSFIALTACQSLKEKPAYEIDSLLFLDQFDTGMDNWVIEVDPDSAVNIGIQDEKLVIDTDRGATAWLNQELSGNLLIRYKRRVVMAEGTNDRLSDMNQFWMARDPRNPNLFTRIGTFAEYDSLLMYYAGIGGNYNETTRFRKYTGDGNRVLVHDLTDEAHLLKPNHTYLIEIMVKDGETSVFVDRDEFFNFKDDSPLSSGYFGIRTTWSRQEIDDLEVYRLK